MFKGPVFTKVYVTKKNFVFYINVLCYFLLEINKYGTVVQELRSSFSHIKFNKASNWQIVAQIKLFSDLCDGISLYRQNKIRPLYLASYDLFKLI